MSGYAIQCETKEEAQKLFEYFEQANIRWCTGDKVNKHSTCWEDSKEKTCYGPANYEGPPYKNENIIAYGPEEAWNRATIVPFYPDPNIVNYIIGGTIPTPAELCYEESNITLEEVLELEGKL